MHAALIWGKAQKVLCLDMLSHYKSMTEIFPYTCRQSIVIPDILKYYDLPDIAQVMPAHKLYVINPVDCAGKKLSSSKVQELYDGAIERGADISSNLPVDKAYDKFVEFVLEDI